MRNFAIGIPTINRNDLLQEALCRYSKTYVNTDVFIVDNGNQRIMSPHPKTEIYIAINNYGVAKSWNYLCERIFAKGYSHAMILNDDVIVGGDEVSIDAGISRNFNGDMFVGKYGFSAFIISKKLFLSIGRFDENFIGAYYEDCDYYYRANLASSSIVMLEEMTMEVFRGSQSIQKDNSLNGSIGRNREYYIDKWGGEPNHEKFKRPFNSLI